MTDQHGIRVGAADLPERTEDLVLGLGVTGHGVAVDDSSRGLSVVLRPSAAPTGPGGLVSSPSPHVASLSGVAAWASVASMRVLSCSWDSSPNIEASKSSANPCASCADIFSARAS